MDASKVHEGYPYPQGQSIMVTLWRSGFSWLPIGAGMSDLPVAGRQPALENHSHMQTKVGGVE